MAPDIFNRLRQATKERCCVILRYERQQHIFVVEPHVIHMDKAGNVVVVCLQTRGHSDSGARHPFWQTFFLRKIESVFLLDTTFDVRIAEGFVPNRPEYQHGLTAMAKATSTSTLYKRRDRSENVLFCRARGWLWEVGSAIDRVLSNRP